MSDVVEWLRERAFRKTGPTMEATHTTKDEWIWAEEITRLRAEAEENVRHIQLAGKVNKGLTEAAMEQAEELEFFRAENEKLAMQMAQLHAEKDMEIGRLRAALHEIGYENDTYLDAEGHRRCIWLARKALGVA